MLPESFSSLTTLRTLVLADESSFYTPSVQPFMGLPKLEHLYIFIFWAEGEEVAGLHIEFTHLTKLEVMGDCVELLVRCLI